MECRAVCQNDTLQRAALQSRLALNTFHPPSQSARPPFDDEDNDYDGRTTRRRSCALLLHVSLSILPALSLSLSSLPWSLPVTYLPAYNSSSYSYHTLEPTTYLHYHTQPIQRLTFSLHSLGPFTLPHFSLLISHPPVPFSATICNRISLFLFFSSLSFSLDLSLHRAFSCRSILLPSCTPVLPPAFSPLHHRSLLARSRLTRALILPFPSPRP